MKCPVPVTPKHQPSKNSTIDKEIAKMSPDVIGLWIDKISPQINPEFERDRRRFNLPVHVEIPDHIIDRFPAVQELVDRQKISELNDLAQKLRLACIQKVKGLEKKAS